MSVGSYQVPTGLKTLEQPQLVEFWLVRHGQSVWNAVDKYQGQANVPLSDLGVAEARALAKRLAGQEFAAIYSSDLERAQTTATIATADVQLSCQQQKQGQPRVQTMPELREILAGVLSGLSTAEICTRHPDYIERLNADPWHTPRPEGESMQDLLERTVAALRSICCSLSVPAPVSTATQATQRVLVFTHGGVIRTAVALGLGLSGSAASHCARLNVANTSLTRLLLGSDERVAGTLLSFNDDAHLRQ